MLLAEKVTWPFGGRQESTPTRKRLREKKKKRRRRRSKRNICCIPKSRRKREKPEKKIATGQTQVFIGNSTPNSNSHPSEDVFLETMGDKTLLNVEDYTASRFHDQVIAFSFVLICFEKVE